MPVADGKDGRFTAQTGTARPGNLFKEKNHDRKNDPKQLLEGRAFEPTLRQVGRLAEGWCVMPTPTTKEVTNSKRSSRAERALDAYQETKRGKAEIADLLGDLLCDLRHLADTYGIDFPAVNKRAKKAYYEELAEEMIHANCRFECQCCGRRWNEDELLPVQDVFERVAPGEPMPAGECPTPECGALCHEVKH